MRNLQSFTKEKLTTIVNASECTAVLRDMCFAELQRRFREEHRLVTPTVTSSSVYVSPMINAGVPKYG